jgi:hypothetical protein
LTSLKKTTSAVLLELWKNSGIAVYIPEETILKAMEGKIEKLKAAFVFLPSL